MRYIYVIINDEKEVGTGEKFEFPFFDEKKFKRMNEQGFSIFKTANPMIGVKRGEQYVQELKHIFCSYEFEGDIDKKVNAMNTLIEYCEPTKIIETGAGIDVLWEIKNTDPFNIEEYKEVLKSVQGYSRKLLGTCKIDDVAGILRVENFEDKSTLEDVMCSIVFESENKYSYRFLDNKFGEFKERSLNSSGFTPF